MTTTKPEGSLNSAALCRGRRDRQRPALAAARFRDQHFPRRQWPPDALASYGWLKGNIPPDLRAEEGRALCAWGDDGWGEQVRRGKQVDGRFDDELVAAAVAMLHERWRPDPFPTWVTSAKRYWVTLAKRRSF